MYMSVLVLLVQTPEAKVCKFILFSAHGWVDGGGGGLLSRPILEHNEEKRLNIQYSISFK